MRRLALALLALLLGVFFAVSLPARPAHACSCASLGDDRAFADAEAVFVGELVEIRTPSGQQWSSADPERFIFRVSKVYKGRVYATQSVVTARSSASCGLELAVGPGPILLFASPSWAGAPTKIDGELHAQLCAGTRSVAWGGVPESFGPGVAPLAGSSPIGPRSWTRPVAITLGVIALAGLGIVVLARRRPRPTSETFQW